MAIIPPSAGFSNTIWSFATAQTIADLPEPVLNPAPTTEEMSNFINSLQSKRKYGTKEPLVKEDESRVLQELYGYQNLKIDKARSTAYEKQSGITKPEFKWCTLDGHVGIEIEVENMGKAVPLEAYWSMKEDGSLRNNGIELVSVPLQIKQVEHALKHAFTAMSVHNQPDFSNRTSIHVHLNCRDMTPDQVWNLVILYALFERHFYQVAGTRRMNSIFCVPLHRCNILSSLNNIYNYTTTGWHKYAGLNILPLFDHDGQRGYGTIEFRHLYGTSDVAEILHWVNDILALRKAARTIKKADLLTAIKEMNTTSSYFTLYHQVFADARRLLTKKIDFESCISNIKRELFGTDYLKEITPYLTDKSVFWQVAKRIPLKNEGN